MVREGEKVAKVCKSRAWNNDCTGSQSPLLKNAYLPSPVMQSCEQFNQKARSLPILADLKSKVSAYKKVYKKVVSTSEFMASLIKFMGMFVHHGSN